jgi:Domain of unknown function (DUF4062)
MKVFIASTIFDLSEYRKIVVEVLEGQGISVVSMDDMISKALAQDTLRTNLLSELETSDLVIVIVGHRYGSIDPTSGLGWVEGEFRAAMSYNRPILAFMEDHDAPYPQPTVDVDGSRIHRFRTAVESEYLTTRFRSPTDLAAKLAIAVTNFIRRSSNIGIPADAMSPRRQTVRIIRILLSSPGDVANERDAAATAVFDYNQREVEASGNFIRLIRWEDMAPQIGPTAQDVINKQIGGYDMFVGIMWNRFGTPTDVAASGTEEEFRAALFSWQSKQTPWITFYFCSRPSKFVNEKQTQQKAKVIRFRRGLTDKGIIREYKSVVDFRNILLQDFLKIVPRLRSDSA